MTTPGSVAAPYPGSAVEGAKRARVRNLSRRLAYTLVVASFGAAYGALVFIVGEAWGAHAFAHSAFAFSASFLIALLVGIPLLGMVQRRLDALVSSRGPGSRLAIRALLGQMASSTDLASLVRRALEAMTADLELERVALFLVPPQRSDFVLVSAQGERPTQEQLQADHPLVQMLAALHVELTRQTLASHPRYANVRPQCLETFDRLGAEVLLPIETGGELVGLLVVGKPRQPFGSEAIELLRTLTVEIGLCVVRARDADRLRDAKLELERFARFLPRAIASNVLAGRLPGEGGRRRAVTVVACELDGFSTLAEELAPEELAQLLGKFHAIADEETAKQGGTLARVRGGTVVALCGDPEPSPDHVQRGIRMATRLRARARALCAQSVHAGPALDVRIGIDAGVATVGFIAVGARLDYHVIGQVMLSARALCAGAGAGEILVGESTLRAAATIVGSEPAGVVTPVSGASLPAHRLTAVEGAPLAS
ncbi:MAG: GAF domain-containing protein [Deltaproteobacteria bacterium]|nr:GAF domain-containing protein [Deltaproteobacteria bacterium]